MRRTSIARVVNRSGTDCPGPVMEALDSRVLMDSAPLPLITDLENPEHTVVRLETNFGDIDLEMLDTVAPITVANFLKYVRDGDYDDTFFHRLVPGFIMQGGRARYTFGTGTQDIPRDGPITNEFNRSNIARTLAMAKLGPPQGQQPTPETINSATSEWFFNLTDNAANLDNQNGGFTVFARVANQRSWDVVLDMADSQVQNLGSPYNELPLTDDYNPNDGVQDAELLNIIDAEIIKPAGIDQFYTYRIYYPEGFSGSTINEFIPMGNPNGERVYFQAITRAERAQTQPTTGDFWYRDKVLFTSSIGPTARRGFTVSTARTTDTDLIFQQGVPYAFEIWATAPITANLSHYDFGSATGESFTDTASTTWFLSNAEKDDNVFDFPVWQNVGDTTATVTLTFYFRNTAPVTVTRTTEPLRRGGLNLSQLAEVPNDRNFAVRIVSTQPIVAALTHYNNGSGTGATELGTPGDGSVRGILPLANRGSDTAVTNTTLDFANPNSVGAVVTLTVTFTDPSDNEITITPSALIIQPNRRSSIRLSDIIGVGAGENVTVRYSSGSTNIYAHVLHLENSDEVSHPVSQTAATTTLFSEGFMDPARAGINVFETVSVFNPNFNVFGVPAADAEITFRFLFTDSTFIDVDRTIAGGRRLDLVLHQLDDLLEQGADFGRYFYSIQVISNVPIVAQMRHYDLTLGDGTGSGGFATLGLQSGTIRDLDNLDGV